jgi:hypothetical protein
MIGRPPAAPDHHASRQLFFDVATLGSAGRMIARSIRSPPPIFVSLIICISWISKPSNISHQIATESAAEMANVRFELRQERRAAF